MTAENLTPEMLALAAEVAKKSQKGKTIHTNRPHGYRKWKKARRQVAHASRKRMRHVNGQSGKR
jgi:hypothetical protein